MSIAEKLSGLLKPNKKGPAERAGKKLDRTTQRAKAKVGRSLDKAGEKIANAGKKLKASVD